ncbi:hypothetical protein BV898_05391 [Hypsibius exemplaris]|uniref:Secreted protein n=1 Tax=Hypsibius exemplaris TaxID=2072580 RepID=A0A1W0WZE5_HYPEX|nr:hypothetical protein BV898_05391 [Hypsibius exemplaris]
MTARHFTIVAVVLLSFLGTLEASTTSTLLFSPSIGWRGRGPSAQDVGRANARRPGGGRVWIPKIWAALGKRSDGGVKLGEKNVAVDEPANGRLTTPEGRKSDLCAVLALVASSSKVHNISDAFLQRCGRHLNI